MTSALSSQRFCLRWNNHQSNLLSVFDQLLHDESFVDVTLAVEGRFLRAHKMVLSACSPYFQALFVGHPDKHPIVILKDVPYCDMRSLLDFMYRGEVSVDQDRLTAFLKVAESLRIKGLTEVNEEKCDLPSITSSLLSSVPVVTTHTPPPPPHLHRIHPAPSSAPSSHKRSVPHPPPHSTGNPLLGSALTAPKRKRGRPRKLSGSSAGGSGGPPNLLPATPSVASLGGGAADNASSPGSRSQASALLDGNGLMETPNRLGGGGGGGSNAADSVVQGSPEMLEVKMSMDFQQQSPSAVQRQSEGENGSGPTSIPSPEHGRASSKELIKRIKEEPEPAPGPSSQDPGQAFVRPGSTHETENYALDAAGPPSFAFLEDPPSITVEVFPAAAGTAGVHFLSPHQHDDDDDDDAAAAAAVDADDLVDSHAAHHCPPPPLPPPGAAATARAKHDLLEYLIRDDGSVVCKWCGEVLPSRTHWYRHKYKFHVPSSSSSSSSSSSCAAVTSSSSLCTTAAILSSSTMTTTTTTGSAMMMMMMTSPSDTHHHNSSGGGTPSPASLFKCTRCNVFFKSRKGYAGHIAARHVSGGGGDGDDVGGGEEDGGKVAVSGDDGMAVTVAVGGRRSTRSSSEAAAKGPDYERQREREEKLVAEIIDRVRRECEAQGETVSRRGYSRRSTVMNS